MYSHLELIFDQLDTLQELLQRESQVLNTWVAAHLSGWDQEDYQTLVQHIDSLSSDMSQLGAGLNSGPLRTRLYDIREFSTLLLNTQQMASAQEAQLRLIHLTSADLLDIVDEIAQR